MKKLLLFLFLLLPMLASAQLPPPVVRNPYSTNLSNNLNLTNMIAVAKSGSDSFGKEGYLVPYLTITAAKNAANAGDTIHVYPGVYAETNLLKNGVNYFFEPGVILSNNPSDLIGGAIFGDRGTGGPTTNVVLGKPEIWYCTGSISNANSASTMNPEGDGVLWTYGSTNGMGAIVFTNTNSVFIADLGTITYSSFTANTPRIQAAINIDGCKYVDIKVSRIMDAMNTNSGIKATGDVDSTSFPPTSFPIYISSSQSMAIYWKKGETHISCDYMDFFGQYGIWCDEPASELLTSPTDFHYHGDTIRTKIYISGLTTNLLNWITFNVLDTTQRTPEERGYATPRRDGLSLFGGKSYIRGQKVIVNTGYAVDIENGTNGVWLDVQKLTSATNTGNTWVNMANSGATTKAYIRVQEYEDGGLAGPGIINTSGNLFLQGGYMKVLNGKGIQHIGGFTYLEDFHIDTSNTGSTNNNPILVSATGLYMKSVVLTAPSTAGTYSIHSVAASSVGIQGVVVSTKTNSPNISFSPNVGIFGVDANVK